jgi:uncharacterized protein (TIGR04141 family)
MSKYNVYKIIPEKTSALLDKLASVDLGGRRIIKKKNYTMQLFFHNKPDEKDVPWFEQYKDFIDENSDEIKNKTYFAVLLIFKGKKALYAVSLGKSHFYLQDFCDLDFGVNIGIRILDENSVNSKNAKIFGSTRKKSLIIYKPNTPIDIESGESVMYLKGKTVNGEKWGKNLICGTSAYFSIKDFPPASLPSLIDSIEETLKTEPLFNIPRANWINNPSEIAKLDRELINAFKDIRENVEIEEQSLSGVDFIFKKDLNLSIRFDGCNGWLLLEDQSIFTLMNILDENGFILSPENIETVKIRATPDEGRPYSRNLRHFIDYVNDDNYFLSMGKWYKLNQNYVNYLFTELDRINIESGPVKFSMKKYNNFMKSLTGKEKQEPWYQEKYFNDKECINHGFISLDRKLRNFNGFKLEVADLYKDDAIYHVKIGKLSKQNYLLQQCITSLKFLKNNKYKLTIDGKEIKPTTIYLWCILNKKEHIKSLKELRSFIFLSELLDCYKAIKNANLDAEIIIDYIE